MQAKDRHTISALVSKFIELAAGVEGILDINSDEWLANNVVVVIDSKVFKGHLPSNFNGLNIHTIDVRKVLKEGRSCIAKIKKTDIDYSIEENYKAGCAMVRTMELCKEFVKV